uniref:hypothetical protein n=1 Tax=Ophiocordyceps sobolifera TaxID=94213 RepID=UPI0030E0C6E7
MMMIINSKFNTNLQKTWTIYRYYSTNNIGNNNIVPVVIYTNADTQKELIFNENKGKSGVYRWVNNINGNTYIGSGVNLTKRFSNYYSYKLMELYLKNRNSLIYRALMKYGYSNFNLEILEYCMPDKAIEREQFYIDNLSPTYNILTLAGSRLGVQHSENTKKLMSAAAFGVNNPFFGKTHSEKTKLLMSVAQKNRPK